MAPLPNAHLTTCHGGNLKTSYGCLRGSDEHATSESRPIRSKTWRSARSLRWTALESSPSWTLASRSCLAVYAGEIYPIGQFGSIVRIHFGRKLIYALVGRLRMKRSTRQSVGQCPALRRTKGLLKLTYLGKESGRTTNAVRASCSSNVELLRTRYLSKRSTSTPKAELRFIYGYFKGAVIRIGEHVGAGGAPCYADLNELFGKHTAILGSTGAGKSAAVAAIVHSVIQRGEVEGYVKWRPQVVILDPHNEYGRAFKAHMRLSTDEGTLSLPYWLLDLDETVGLLIGKTEYAATSQANIVKNALLSARSNAAETSTRTRCQQANSRFAGSLRSW